MQDSIVVVVVGGSSGQSPGTISLSQQVGFQRAPGPFATTSREILLCSAVDAKLWYEFHWGLTIPKGVKVNEITERQGLLSYRAAVELQDQACHSGQYHTKSRGTGGLNFS